MTSDIFSGFPVLSTAQADQGHHHDGERGHGRCLPRLLREPQEPVYGGESTHVHNVFYVNSVILTNSFYLDQQNVCGKDTE